MLVGCPFCHHTHATLYREKQPLRADKGECRNILRCDDCRLLYPDRRLGVSQSIEYIAQHNLGPDGVQEILQEPRVEFADTNIAALLLKDVERNGRALDIGTWNGEFTHIYGVLGYDSYGLEPHKEAVAFACSKGLRVFQGAFPDDVPRKLLSSKYKLISMLDSMYYLHDLQKSFLKVRRMLKDDGVFLVACHQGYSPYYEANLDHSYFSRYGDYVQGIPTYDALQYCLNRSGFKTLSIVASDNGPVHKSDRFGILSGKS